MFLLQVPCFCCLFCLHALPSYVCMVHSTLCFIFFSINYHPHTASSSLSFVSIYHPLATSNFPHPPFSFPLTITNYYLSLYIFLNPFTSLFLSQVKSHFCSQAIQDHQNYYSSSLSFTISFIFYVAFLLTELILLIYLLMCVYCLFTLDIKSMRAEILPGSLPYYECRVLNKFLELIFISLVLPSLILFLT